MHPLKTGLLIGAVVSRDDDVNINVDRLWICNKSKNRKLYGNIRFRDVDARVLHILKCLRAGRVGAATHQVQAMDSQLIRLWKMIVESLERTLDFAQWS